MKVNICSLLNRLPAGAGAIVLVSFRAAERAVKQTVCDCESVCFYTVKNAHPWRGGKLKMAISVTGFCKGNYSSSVDRESTP